MLCVRFPFFTRFIVLLKFTVQILKSSNSPIGVDDQKRLDFYISVSLQIRSMSYAQNHRVKGGYVCNEGYIHNEGYICSEIQPSFNRNNGYHHQRRNSHNIPQDFAQKPREHVYNYNEVADPSFKRRKFSASTWEDSGRYQQPSRAENRPSTSSYSALPRPVENAHFVGSKRCREEVEDEVEFMSRAEIENFSPSRKDGIDPLRETYLRYSYCAFIQNLGMRLEMPQTTIGTAMVLCHRFFVRRSHACHDRFLIATAALFLAGKSEESLCQLNNILRASCEICYKQGLNFFPSLLPVDWFQQYRERVIEAETMILTTLDFELNVQHPYDHLTSVLNKLGLSEAVLVNLALSLISEGLRSSLWLQFKPHHIAAGAAYLAAKFLNLDLGSHHQRMWQEFQTTPAVLHDVVQQLMELF